MADTVAPQRRSEIMSRIRAKGMKPEMRVRRLVHSMGYRYRLHRKDLPGKPDLVFPGRRKVIFVQGRCKFGTSIGRAKVDQLVKGSPAFVGRLERSPTGRPIRVAEA